jgi:hypothetical protein
MKMNNLYQEVRNWIYRNARPLELARWQYHFEDGKTEEVIKALSAYQNEDGGFGHALEADCWNPNSAPIQTFHAVEMLKEIKFTDRNHPLIQGILNYMGSGSDFEEMTWRNTIPSNNDYPHAPWWHTDSESVSHNRYNPSVGLAGFGLYFTEKNSPLYEKCTSIAKKAVEELYQMSNIDMHALTCFITLMEYCEQAKITDLFSPEDLKKKIVQLVNACITKETDRWSNSYCCKPSYFFNTPESIFYLDNKEAADYECGFIKNTRNQEGIWDITWGWEGYPEEWSISKNWWKGHVVIGNMLYLKNFGVIN